jgi:glycosyltransferase involved in cell wall biosynthesis
MTGGLNELAASLGIDPLVPSTPPNPRFSTIVRTQGRRPDSLAEALASIAAQTYANHETLLIVHHPDPGTAAAVEAALPDDARPPGLRVVAVTEGDRSRPLNVGLATADADYVCILDDDDYVTDRWLAAFAEAATSAPGTMLRAIALSEPWTSEGGYQPVRVTGPRTRDYADTFDLLAHVSHNETPPCSVALPLAAMQHFGLEFDEELPVFEDWELFMRVAQICGVTSIDEETAIYRRIDHGNADTEVDEHIWHVTHARVIDRLSARPVLVPLGDARRVASAHFIPGTGSRWERDYLDAQAELDALTRSPLRYARVFGRRLLGAVRHRLPFGRD